MMMIKEWKNPCFPFVGSSILHAGNSLLQQQQVQITKDMIQHMTVIQQVDRKFILTKLGSQLFILDQHAVDERIQLEQMQSQIFGKTGAEANVPVQNIQISFEVSVREKYVVATAVNGML
jgi:DNA mismatch repair ATPase MutL